MKHRYSEADLLVLKNRRMHRNMVTKSNERPVIKPGHERDFITNSTMGLARRAVIEDTELLVDRIRQEARMSVAAEERMIQAIKAKGGQGRRPS